MAYQKGSWSKSLQFTKKDYVLNKWRATVLKNPANNMSLLVRTALKYYIKNNSTCCIGKIHLSEQDILLSEKHTVGVYLGDSPDINSWMKSVKCAGMNLTAIIKGILLDSIEFVEDPSQEWIPSSYELYQLEFFHDLQPTGNHDRQQHITTKLSAKYADTADESLPKKDLTNDRDTGFDRSSEINNMVDSKPIKKKPRAYAFSGKHFKNS